LLLLGVAALALRLWGLTRQSLWIDEMFSLKYAQPGQALHWSQLRENLHGPLHALLLHLWCGIAGWGELALRLPQALASAATVPLLFVVARPVFGPRRAAVGAIALALNPFHIWYAQEVRNYAFLVLFTVLALGAIQKVEEDDRLRSIPSLALSWIGGLLFNLSFAFHIASSTIWGIARMRARPARMAAIAAAGAITLLAMIPWGIEFYRQRVSQSYLLRLESVPQEERLRGEATAPALALPYAAYAWSVGYSLGPSVRELRRSPSAQVLARHPFAIGATAVCFGALGIVGLWSWVRDRGRRRLWLLCLLVPLLLAFLAASRNVKVFNPRYVSVALPAYVMLLADGAAAVRPRYLGIGLAAGALILSVSSIVQLQTQPRYWKEDARSAARVLRSEVAAGDLILVDGTWDPIYRYYWPGLREDRAIRRWFVPFREGPEGPRAEEALAAVRGARRTYVLFYRDDFHDPDGAWETFLKERFPIDRAWEFPGARIWRLAGGGAS
jgi:4-amino-4-deoxy-L-arabinose transferase-like glycosyltransferase